MVNEYAIMLILSRFVRGVTSFTIQLFSSSINTKLALLSFLSQSVKLQRASKIFSLELLSSLILVPFNIDGICCIFLEFNN